MEQFDMDAKIKTPDASMLSIESKSIVHDTKQPRIPKDLMAQLQANDSLQNLIPNLFKNLKSALPRDN